MSEVPRSPVVRTVGIPTRLVIVGDSTVGKTTLINSFFSRFEHTKPTIEPTPRKVPQKEVDALLQRELGEQLNRAPYAVELIDSGGQVRMRPAYTAIFSKADAFVLVCALNDRESFDNLQEWKHQLHLPRHKPLIIIGNKMDLEDADKKVTPEEIKDTFDSIGHLGTFFITSAKQTEQIYKESVQKAFSRAIVMTVKSMMKQRSTSMSSYKLRDSKLDPMKKKRRCC